MSDAPLTPKQFEDAVSAHYSRHSSDYFMVECSMPSCREAVRRGPVFRSSDQPLEE